METIFNMEEGEKIIGFFLIREQEIKQASNGSEYATFILERHLQQIQAKLWDLTDQQKLEFRRKAIVKIEGVIISYRGQKQVNIKRIRLATEEDHINVTELISRKGIQREELWHELRLLMDEIQSESLRAIIRNLYSQREIREKVTTIPASKRYHHSYYAGLLHHIVVLSQSAIQLLPLYPIVNKDLVLATCLLHDLGKTKGFTEALAPEVTMSGEMMGHIALSLEMVHDAAKEEGITGENVELLSLKHCIASQSGEVRDGYGSAVSPKTAEALFFHHIKQLNIGLHTFDVMQEYSNEAWMYSPMFKRKLYTPKHE